VVAGAGAVEHKQLADLSEKYFGSLPTAAPSDIENPEDLIIKDATFTGSDLRVRDDNKPLAHLAIAFEAAGWTDSRAFDLMTMQCLLGSWDRTATGNVSSKLCRTVAERECAYSVMAFNTCYKETGLFGVYATAAPTDAEELSWCMMEGFLSLVHETTEDEVERAKLQLKSVMLSQLDGSSAVCEDIGRQMLTYNRRITPAEVFARIDAVNASTIREAANFYLNDNDIAVAGIGSIYEVPDYNWLRRRTYSLMR